MPHITTCTTCGLLYEESSEECADARVRECLNCFMEARYAIESPFIELFEASAENDIDVIIGNIYENPELLK